MTDLATVPPHRVLVLCALTSCVLHETRTRRSAEAWVRRHPAWSLYRWAALPDSNVVLVSVLPAGMRVS